jgi:hypothetical protein
MLVVEYLNNEIDEFTTVLLHKKDLTQEELGRCRGVIELSTELLNLPSELNKLRIPTEEEKQKIQKTRFANQSYGVPQAVAMGQTRYTGDAHIGIEAED